MIFTIQHDTNKKAQKVFCCFLLNNSLVEIYVKIFVLENVKIDKNKIYVKIHMHDRAPNS